MKRIVFIFLIISSMLSFIIVFKQFDNKEMKKIDKVEEKISQEFTLPNEARFSDPEQVYPILFQSAEEYRVNIFRKSVKLQSSNDENEILKYILLTSKTEFFNYFQLDSGKELTQLENKNTDFYMSTSEDNSDFQIGVIRDFGGNDVIKIKHLKSSFQHLPAYGKYFAEAKDEHTFQSFIDSIAKKINNQNNSKVLVQKEDLLRNNDSNIEGTTYHEKSFVYLEYIEYIILAVVLFLFLYLVLSQSKEIAVLKIHGISVLASWFISIEQLIIKAFAISTIIISVISCFIIGGGSFNFLYAVITRQLIMYSIFTFFTILLYFIYSRRINLTQSIKNKKGNVDIYWFNIFVKIIASVSLILMSTSILSKYEVINEEKDNLSNWERSKEYGVFFPFNIGEDQEEVNKGLPTVFHSIDKMYKVFNDMGSLLINTKMYEEQSLILDKNYTGIRSIKVNPNYLKEFPVYDTQQRVVEVSDETENFILLVPEKYKRKEEKIKRFFRENRKDKMDVEQNFYNRPVSDAVENQEIEIIWLANNTSIFSFNPEVFRTEGNIIIDPIIQVITLRNSVAADRGSILGGGNTDPLKVKLIDQDVPLTYDYLYPFLEDLNLDDNLNYLIEVDHLILEKINDLQSEASILIVISNVLFLGFILLISQNLSIFFNKNKKKYVILRLHGIHFMKTYKMFVVLFSLIGIIQMILCSLIEPLDGNMLLMIGVVLSLEAILSVILLIIIERRNMVDVLKGE